MPHEPEDPAGRRPQDIPRRPAPPARRPGGSRVVAEAEDGLAALDLAVASKPDVAVLDISMPGLNGIEVTRNLARDCPEVKVVILSMHSDRRFVLEALRAGARGYMLKDAGFPELLGAIRAVGEGKGPSGSVRERAGGARLREPGRRGRGQRFFSAFGTGAGRSCSCWPRDCPPRRSPTASTCRPRPSSPTARPSWTSWRSAASPS